MMRGETLILGHRVKGQVPFWHSVYKTLWTRYRLVWVQSLSNCTCKLLMMEKGNLYFWGYGVKGQGQFWHCVQDLLPCEGMPRLVLSSSHHIWCKVTLIDPTCYVFPALTLICLHFVCNVIEKNSYWKMGKRSMSGLSPHTSNIIGKTSIDSSTDCVMVFMICRFS